MPAKKPAPKPVAQRPSKSGSKPARPHAPPPVPERVVVKAPEITPAERRELRAKAHHLHPVVIVGQHGLTPSVLHELDVNLLAHELIKVRVFSDARAERDQLFARICAELDAAPVQHIGKLLVLWRPAPAEPAAKKVTYRRRAGATGDARAGKSPPPRGRARDTAAGEEPRGKRRPLSRPLGKNAKNPGSITGKTMAKSTPQARHPRSPEARTVARPPSSPATPARRPAGALSGSDVGGRRQRGQPGAGPRGPAAATAGAPMGSASDNRRRRRGG